MCHSADGGIGEAVYPRNFRGPTVQPFINTRGLGYGREAIRGYEYYVIDGQRYFLTRNNIKFELMSKKVVQAGFIPLNKFNTIPFSFYLNLFLMPDMCGMHCTSMGIP